MKQYGEEYNILIHKDFSTKQILTSGADGRMASAKC